ncbi:type II secretion system secretin GspD [Algicola sagamiensis]|uniref:type II secretion system secretin GspD n=1 Tax=Algicola sagamiensis TaxID=163869 RepID=UPI001FDFBECA|nr:type II secretion system secretin GspD [Algicola sagamiensis]
MRSKLRPGMSRVIKPLSVACLSVALTFGAGARAVEYSPNFKGTDINEFINIVGKNLKKTIIIDPNVRGKINVRSYEMLTEKQYYQFFLNVLQVYGYAVVEMDNGIIKIVRNKDGKHSAIPVVSERNPGQGDEMVTRVVEVKNVSVRELSPLLRQFSNQTQGGHVVHYDPSNVIMMTGNAAVVNRLVEIIRRVDHAGDRSVDIIPLKHASASEIVRVVEKITKESGGKRSQPTFLIPKVVADERTNSVIVSGEPQARKRVKELVQQLDSELKTSGNTRVFYLKYAKAEDLVKVLKGVSDSISKEQDKGKKGSKASGGRNISIEAHKENNALVITAQPDMMRSLQDVIRQLDVKRLQVLVEAIIVEVFDSDGVDLGVQWASRDFGLMQFNNGKTVPIGSLAVAGIQAKDTTNKTTETRRVNGTDQPVQVETTERGDYSGLASLLGGFNGVLTGVVKDDWGALVNFVSTNTKSNLLSTPSIMTMDNEEAYFIVGSEVPIISQSQTTGTNTNPLQSVERKEVGIKLKVTPQINEGSGIQMKIEQEVSKVEGATAVDITIAKREIKTTVMVEDGAVISLGGLIDDDVQESVSKVPLLGDIPILGHLFKSTSTTKRKRNLMVFIRPTIVKDSTKMNEISYRKYNFMRAKELMHDEDGIDLMPFTKGPMLPEWESPLEVPPHFEQYMEGDGVFKDDVQVAPQEVAPAQTDDNEHVEEDAQMEEVAPEVELAPEAESATEEDAQEQEPQ